uniref:Stimulated by retinoic acid gene 6 protein-like n=1 Tax=Varanus komodoensis TaxID=61221 RepID=A0A8D2IR27_VARKO
MISSTYGLDVSQPGSSPVIQVYTKGMNGLCQVGQDALEPLDFMGAYSNRWSLSFAFGATATKVMILFSEGYGPEQVLPQWAHAIVLFIGATEVGLSSYPFFVCLSTRFQIIGACLGFLYTGTWTVVMIVDIIQCPHGLVVGEYEKIIFYWPSLLCKVFLLGRFAYIFVQALRVRLQMDLNQEETSFLELHQAQYVQQLMKKPPTEQPPKSWIQQKVYEWDPLFQFPCRMICMGVLAMICLYMVSKGDLLVLRVSAPSQVDKPVMALIQSLEEFIDVTEGVWTATTFTACLTCVSYVFHILACYRKHMKRLWAGQKQFLPVMFSKCSSSQSVAAIARYSGWQIAYILWGYLIIHVVQCLFGVLLMYSFVLPVKNGQGVEMVKNLGIGILTLCIIIGFILLQVLIAARFFLQPKILENDKEKPLALDNRRGFQNFNYFFFFYNVLLGLGSCLFRLLSSIVVGAWLIARIDRTIMPKGYEALDMGFRTWIGMLFLDHYHTNPTLICFCHILVLKARERPQQGSTYYQHFNNATGKPEVSKKSRTRWLLLYTLLNNPSLSALRKSQ